jgi:MFS family permease
MKEKNKKTPVGIASILLGILGLIFYFIGWFFYSFVDNRLYGMVIGLIFGIVAIILGYIAKKKGDYYGIYGLYLGILIVVIALLTVLLTTVTSVETGYY